MKARRILSKTALLILLFTGLNIKSKAQTDTSYTPIDSLIITDNNSIIPGNAVIVSSNQSDAGSYKIFWVCNGSTLTVSGDYATVYLEPGASVSAGGLYPVIYAPANSQVNISGSYSTVNYVDPGGISNSSDSYSVLRQCSSITYDYSNAPVNGCH